jgi:multicomponent Na+:H+ antiporter subunit C
MTVIAPYALVGGLLFLVGLCGLFVCENMLQKILAANLSSSGLFLVLVALARRPIDAPPDPIPHALVLTGILVTVSATAVALALHRRLAVSDQTVEAEKEHHH